MAFHCHPDPGPPGSYFSPYGVKPEGEPRGQGRVGTITDGPPGEYIVDRLADEAVKFIEANRDRPFFLNLWNYGVHGPWGHKEEYTRAFAAKKDPRGEQGNPIMASMLRSVDECFGRVLDALDRNGLTENTIVIFNSDNGGNTHSNTPEDAKASKKKGDTPQTAQIGENGPAISRRRTTRRCGPARGRCMKAGTRVPLMWSWPGRIRGRERRATPWWGTSISIRRCSSWSACRCPPQQKMDGVSYAAVLKQTGTLEPAGVFQLLPARGRASAGPAAFGCGRAIGS